MLKLNLEMNSEKPKYLQLVEGIITQIENGELILGQKLPSVNKLADKFNFSRETVFKALNYLSERGVVKAIDKIGYFVHDVSPDTDFRVFFMLDKFTAFKEDLFNSLIFELGDRAKVSTYFHHQNVELFESLILQNLKYYTHFVITTFIKETSHLNEVLKKIPPEKLIIIDKYESEISKDSGMVFQDFENDVYKALKDNISLVEKYKKLIMINHKSAPHGEFVKKGFDKFCNEFMWKNSVYDDFIPDHFERGNLYITIDAYDRDMVEVVKMTRNSQLELGHDIGLISYNETTTKEILEGGITVISTDFKRMGAEAAKMILKDKRTHKYNPTTLILRGSL